MVFSESALVIGDRLAAARKRGGLTQVELAVALGDRYNQQMISHVERGRSSLLVDGLVSVSKELSVSADYLVGLTEDPVPSDLVSIQQFEGITGARQGNVSLSKLERFPVSSNFLTNHKIDPHNARFIEVRGQSMYPTVPQGSVALVDKDRKWLKHNLIYLIVINAWTPNATYEIRRLRGEDSRDQQWHTDFYLDLKDAGWEFQDGELVLHGRGLQDGGTAWPANSWRRELWLDEMRASLILSRSASQIAPIPHGTNVRVEGQVRGLLHVFDDMGW